MRESVIRGFMAAGLAVVFVVGAALTTQAAVPQLLNFQGILLDTEQGTVNDSTYDLTFRIYDDSTGGTVQWEENQTVKTENGLFNTFLGRSVPLPESVFDEDNRWFEIELIGVGPYEPRNRVGSVAYAYRVQTVDGATGGSIYGNVQLHSGLTAGDLEGEAGFLAVTDGSQTVFSTDGASAATLFSGSGSDLALDMASSGDNSVQLPADAVSAGELLNEPGLAADFDSGPVVLTQGSLVMADLATASITIPTDGYIVVQGRSNFATGGTAGENIVFVQIDETQGGGDLETYRSEAGIQAHSNSGTHNFLFTVFNDRIYFKAAGTYTFRLEARASENNSDGATGSFSGSFLTATFYPTSYGSVNAPVSANKGTLSFGATAASSSGPDGRTDLRELELQAARLRAASERAQRELLEARLKTAAGR